MPARPTSSDVKKFEKWEKDCKAVQAHNEKIKKAIEEVAKLRKNKPDGAGKPRSKSRSKVAKKKASKNKSKRRR